MGVGTQKEELVHQGFVDPNYALHFLKVDINLVGMCTSFKPFQSQEREE